MRGRAAAVVLLVALGACAPRAPIAPPAAIAPKFPEFVVPVVPAGLGSPAARERHDVAWRWLQAGDLRAAERNFASALKQGTSFFPAEAGLGYVALARKDFKESLQHFDRALNVNPQYAPALAGRAEALLALGHQDAALQSLEAALAADPGLTSLRSRVEVLRFRTQQETITRARQLAEGNRLAEARSAYTAAIAASPDSPFLYRELAEVERRDGNLTRAVEHARRAAELDPDEPRTQVLLGELHEMLGETDLAIEAYTAALALQPDDRLEERIEQLQARAAFAAMPEEYRGIESAATISRAQLSALLAVRLEPLLAGAPRLNAVVVTDTRGHWAAPYILTVARAGIMEVYPNHTFQPNALVRRGDMAQAVSRVLELIARANPRLAAAWRNPRRQFPDVGPRHLAYPAAALAVEAGVMAPAPDGSFNLTRPVSGAEAAAAVATLQQLAGLPVR